MNRNKILSGLVLGTLLTSFAYSSPVKLTERKPSQVSGDVDRSGEQLRNACHRKMTKPLARMWQSILDRAREKREELAKTLGRPLTIPEIEALATEQTKTSDAIDAAVNGFCNNIANY